MSFFPENSYAEVDTMRNGTIVITLLCFVLLCLGAAGTASAAGSDMPGGLFDSKPKKSVLVPVAVGGLYGYLTPKGQWAVTPRFEAANPFAKDGTA